MMSEAVTGAIFIACLGVGFSVGIFVGYPEVGGGIGLGSGLLSSLILRNKNKHR